MGVLHSVLIWIHIVAGTVSIVTFWIPTLVKKGSPLHKNIGRWYVNAMYVVTITALGAAMIRLFAPLSLLDPLLANNADEVAKFVRRSQLIGVFLTVLALLVLANVRHGVLVLRAKADRQQLRQPAHLTVILMLGAAGLIGLYVGLTSSFVLLKIFSPLALLSSFTMLRYALKAELKRAEWIIEHLNNLLGAGIATHTALIVLGAAKSVNAVIPVSLSVLPWVLPGIIGAVATTIWTRHYRLQLGHREPATAKTIKTVEANV